MCIEHWKRKKMKKLTAWGCCRPRRATVRGPAPGQGRQPAPGGGNSRSGSAREYALFTKPYQFLIEKKNYFSVFFLEIYMVLKTSIYLRNCIYFLIKIANFQFTKYAFLISFLSYLLEMSLQAQKKPAPYFVNFESE